MNLNYVIIYVDDAVKATEFYKKAFELKIKFIHESNMYAEMESGQTTLAFANNEMLQMNTGIEPKRGVRVWNQWDVWQWTGSGSTAGVKGKCDKNWMCGSGLDRLLIK